MRYRASMMVVAVALLLGGFYLLYQRPHARAEKTAAAFQKRFFRADPGDIVSITLQNREGVVEISHRAEGWMIVKPQRYRPDEGIIQRLLETIAAGQLTRVVGEPAELQQFGFDEPVLSLTLAVGGQRDVLVIGQKNPADTAYYAYSESLGKIFLVNKELPRELYLRLYDMREKRLYPEVTPADVARIVLTRDGQGLDVTLVGGEWRLRSPFEAKASPEEIATFLAKLAGQKAVAFIPWREDLVRSRQRMHLQLLDRGGKSLAESEVYYIGTGENEGITVHTPGEHEAVRVGRELWELLEIDPTNLLERRLFPLEFAGIDRIAVQTASEQIVLQRESERWLKNGHPIGAAEIAIVLDMLRNWKTAKLLRGNARPGKTATIIEVTGPAGSARLSVTDLNITREMSSDLAAMHLDSREITYLLAKASGLAGDAIVPAHEVDNFLRQVRQLK